jgi:hypothetical protein
MASEAVRRGFRVISTYAVSVLATYVLASLAATQWTLGALAQMGYAVSASQRLATSAQDLLGMLPSYGLIIAVAMAIGLTVASRVVRYLPGLRGFGLVTAGVLALVGTHLIMQQVLHVSPIAAARTAGGILAQGLAGGVGGYLYYLLRRS